MQLGTCQLFLVLLADFCSRSSQTDLAQPRVWRVVSDVATQRWEVCSVQFFADLQCSTAPSSPVQALSSAYLSYAVGQSSGEIFAKWVSDCETCAKGEAYFGAQYFLPTVVRCVKWQQCPQPTTTTTITTVSTTKTTTTQLSTTPAPGPSPPTPSPFEGLDDIDYNRRLAEIVYPSQMLLQRSDDGASWTTVAEFRQPDGSGRLSLSSAYDRPRESQQPQVASTVPSTKTGCNACLYGGGGIQATENLEITFSESIFPGGGNIRINRGGSLQALDVPSVNTNWFQVSGAKLTIKPQAALGSSGSCSTIRLPSGSLVDADGLGIEAYNYFVCVADYVAPQVQSTVPPNGAGSVGLTPEILIAFNEAVTITAGSSLKIFPTISTSTSFKPTINMAMSEPHVKTQIWNAATGAGAVEIYVQEALARATTYEVRIPSGAITDTAGNSFAGGTVLEFTTTGSASATAAPTPGPSPPATDVNTTSENEESSSGLPVWVTIVIAGIVIIAAAVGLVLLWRWHVQRKHMGQGSRVSPVQTSASTKSVGSSASKATGWSGTAGENGNTAESYRSSATGKTSPKQSSSPFGSPQSGPRSAGRGGEAPEPAAAENPQRTTPGQQRASARARAREAEDAQPAHRKPPPPFNKGNKRMRRGASFTEESADTDGWVKTTDPATGRPYWFHHITLETRWEKPTRGNSSASASSSQANGPKEPSVSKLAPDLENLEEAEEVARVKEDILQQLKKTRNEDGASRKKTFKFMQLRWHPDKNPDDKELATSIFQFLQETKDWYLEGA